MKLNESSGSSSRDLLGVLDCLIVAVQLAVEDAQRGMGQGVVGLVGYKGLQPADRLLQLPLLLQFDRLVIPLFDGRHEELTPRFVETAANIQSNGRGRIRE